MTDAPVDFTAGAPTAGSLDVRWIHGAPASGPADDPPIQVHWYDPHTVILRQTRPAGPDPPVRPGRAGA
jgi:hydroxyacylglutathione hydrolase